MESEGKTMHTKYKPFKSETLVFISTSYAVLSLILVGIFYQFFLSEGDKFFAYSVHSFFSIIFLIYIGFQTKHRTELNKLPSEEIIKVFYLIRKNSNDGGEVINGCWRTTIDSFNSCAMKCIFGDDIVNMIKPYDYLSFLVSERYIYTQSVADHGNNIDKNEISIFLSKKAQSRLAIHEKTRVWK